LRLRPYGATGRSASRSRSGLSAPVTISTSGPPTAPAPAGAADGHRLALLARRVDRVEALAEEFGGGALAIQADVTDRDSIVAAAERVQSELGGADILVNNAGVMLLAPFTSEQKAEIRQMVEVNLLGAMTSTEVFLDQLRDGGGDLINMSSGAPRGRAPRSTTRPSGAWAPGRRPCARSSRPTFA